MRKTTFVYCNGISDRVHFILSTGICTVTSKLTCHAEHHDNKAEQDHREHHGSSERHTVNDTVPFTFIFFKSPWKPSHDMVD